MGLARSQTAKDTYVLFFGNLLSAFLGFVYTLFVARALSVENFGIFSAAVNLVIILISFTDLGVSTGVVNFVAEKLGKGDVKGSREYIKASVVVRVVFTLIVSTILVIFAKFISPTLFATQETTVTYWVAVISLTLGLPMLFLAILQGQKKFFASTLTENSLFAFRLAATAVFIYFWGLTIGNSLFSYALGGLAGTIVGILLVGRKFIGAKPKVDVYSKLMRFSGWIGVNRIITSVSGRLDVAMLAVLLGATPTGFYSIPSRLAGFIVVLTSSFAGVLAPRFAGFSDVESEKKYLVKASFALIPIIVGIIVWILIAEPFIVILFGEKYLPAVPIFQALSAAMIPFVLTVPSVSAIVYSMKKTVFIGAFSFFQIAAIFLGNLFLIPKFGAIGPTITVGVVNTVLAVYTWVIVIRHYWVKEKPSVG